MKYLNTLLQKNEIEPALEQDIAEEYLSIKEKIKQKGIIMDDNSELIFSNHLVVLLQRLNQHKLLHNLDDSDNQISPESICLAEEILRDSFTKKREIITTTEALLVAIHLEQAKNRMK